MDGGVQPRDLFVEVGNRQLAAAVLPDDRGRNALHHLRRGVGCFLNAAIGVAVHVDEPRRDNPAAGIDDPLARTRRQSVAQLCDSIAGDTDIESPRRRAGAVDDGAVLDQEPGWRARRRLQDRQQECKQPEARGHARRLYGRLHRSGWAEWVVQVGWRGQEVKS